MAEYELATQNFSIKSLQGLGTLIASTTPVQGEIFVDSVSKGKGYISIVVSAGTHIVAFGAVFGYDTPPPQTVTVAEGAEATATGIYIAAVFDWKKYLPHALVGGGALVLALALVSGGRGGKETP